MPNIIQRYSDKIGILLVALTLIAGYAGSFIAGWEPPVSGALAPFLLTGVIYFLLLTYGFAWCQERCQSSWHFIYFTLATVLMGLMLYLGDIGSMWIAALPLAGQALALPWAGAILAAGSNFLVQMAVVWFLTRRFDVVFQVGPSLAVAMLFVMMFTWVTTQTEEKNKEIVELAQQLQAANQQLREYAARAEDLAISKERNRMAREIHDSLGHYLTVVNMQLEAARVTLTVDPEKALAAIGKAQRLTREGLADVRGSVAALRESPVENRPVPEALAELIAEAEAAGLVANLVINGEPRPLPPATALTLYRATQEALTNVRKHARASKVDVALDYTPAEQIGLTVIDNGVGTDSANGGFGLLGIQERVQLLRGQFQVTTAAGAGFRLEMSVPG
ncbi:MAG: sensor histidine kinase [Anaerolineales bacterium]|nr:sensor histidine kinase [Anaerolineales bacterium]MCB0005962.1 sensor histidine kinase [Anaerolineales bacterium]MCB0011996.1 sensor histidine kinase [Anaerolineales bacterium]